MQYPKVLYPWIRRYKEVQSLVPWCICLYLLIHGYRTFGYFIVLPCTVMYRVTGNQGLGVLEIRRNDGMYQYVLVHTSTYWYILLHTNRWICVLVYTSIYCDLQVYTSTYQHIPVHTCMYPLILVHTGTYQYIPVYTSSYLSWSGFKKDAKWIRTRDLLHTVRMHSHCAARVQTPDTGPGMCNNGNVCVYINIVHNPACVPGSWCWIDGAGPAPPPSPAMTSTARIWIGISR